MTHDKPRALAESRLRIEAHESWRRLLGPGTQAQATTRGRPPITRMNSERVWGCYLSWVSFSVRFSSDCIWHQPCFGQVIRDWALKWAARVRVWWGWWVEPGLWVMLGHRVSWSPELLQTLWRHPGDMVSVTWHYTRDNTITVSVCIRCVSQVQY